MVRLTEGRLEYEAVVWGQREAEEVELYVGSGPVTEVSVYEGQTSAGTCRGHRALPYHQESETHACAWETH